MNIRVAGITKESIVDGPGIRIVIFTQGCPHNCAGCHNPQTHDINGGISMSCDEIISRIRQSKLIRGVTFSGGEPFLQAAPLALIGRFVKEQKMDTVIYTGYIWEELRKMSQNEPAVESLLNYTDLLIDGPYVASRRDLRLAFRGSSNQRLIDVPQTLRTGSVVEWEDPWVSKFGVI